MHPNINSGLFLIVGIGCVISILGLVIIRSRSQKIEAEAEAKMHSRFLATMSHEIRTPMNGIIGVAEVLKKTDLNDEQLEKLDIILNNSKVLLRLVNDILDFSKIDAGNMPLEQLAYNPKQTLINSFQIIEPLSKEKGLPVHISISDDFPENVLGDEVRLQQILVNLLSNALKFTEKGQIDISAKTEAINNAIFMIFKVKDSGIGMSENELKRIFNPFTQADQSITRKFGGTGLGLVICEKLIALMNGEIKVKSELGKGSTFIIKLPLIHTEHKSLTNIPEETNIPEQTETQSLSILIVDDQQMNLNVASMLLNMMGHACSTALGAKDALSLIKKQKFDMIYMDRHMPEMDGLEATRRIRKECESQTKPWIVALTASAQANEKQEFLDAGANDFMSKPVDFAHFESTVAGYLQQMKRF